MISEMQWVVYAWTDDQGTPYYLSKCRKNSQAPYRRRHEGSNVQPPEDRNLIKILFSSSNEEEVLEKLDKLQYDLGLEEAAPGFGTLKNSTRTSPKALRETKQGKAIAVTVYKTTGEFVGKFPSIGHAAEVLSVNKQNAIQNLHGKLGHVSGYCFHYRNEPFRKEREFRKLWQSLPVVGISPEGKRVLFSTIADAAEDLFEDRKRASGIRNSLKSPANNKRRSKGWAFFYEHQEIPKNISYATAGRKPHK